MTINNNTNNIATTIANLADRCQQVAEERGVEWNEVILQSYHGWEVLLEGAILSGNGEEGYVVLTRYQGQDDGGEDTFGEVVGVILPTLPDNHPTTFLYRVEGVGPFGILTMVGDSIIAHRAVGDGATISQIFTSTSQGWREVPVGTYGWMSTEARIEWGNLAWSVEADCPLGDLLK